MDFEKNIKNLRIVIPALTRPQGVYIPAVKTGNIIQTSGQLPIVDRRIAYPGRVGKEVSIEQGGKAAKHAIVNALAAIKWIIGDLNKIKKIIRMNGFVCSAVGFNDQPKVLNEASELLLDIFGDEVGSHTRTAVGVIELPLKACVEIDLTVEIK